MSSWTERLAQGLALRLIGRRASPSAARMLSLEQTLAVDPRRRIVLVRCGERRMLLLTGGAQDVWLGWLPERAPPDAPAS